MSGDATRSIPGKLVEGVFLKALAPDLTPELLEALAAIGLDLAVPLRPAYPRAVWFQATELVARHLFATHPEPERLRELGRHVMASLKARNVLKGPWLSMAKLLGPRRALHQAADFAKGGPLQLELVERGKHEMEIRVQDGEQPELLAGLLEGTITLLGGKDVRAAVEATTPAQTVFLTTWK